MLPSPMKVISALKTDSALILGHTGTTLTEAFWGLVCGIILGLITAVLMDMCKVLNNSVTNNTNNSYCASFSVMVWL